MAEISRQFDLALAAGFRAVKMEVLFYDLVTDRELIGLIGQGRKALGDDILLAIDFGYRWHNWHDALFVLERIADHNIFFAEATLQHDDLPGHASLAERSTIRIGGAEAAATRFEIREWLTVGKVGVVQPNIGRGGGLKGNQHLHYPQDTPHANILVTMLHRAGIPAQDIEKFADSTGPFSEV